MGYTVPDWKKSINQHQFDVEVNGETFHIIKAEYMTGVQVEQLQRAGSDPGGLYDVLDELCPGLGSALRPVPLKFVTEFVQAWQADSGIELGGIFGLSEFIREHEEAVRYDLLTHGLRLSDIGGALSWREVGALVHRWGGLPGTATFRSVHGYEGWGIEAQLLAHALDMLQVLDYHQLRIGGSRSARKPERVERPWEKKASFGSGAIPYDEIDAWVESTWR